MYVSRRLDYLMKCGFALFVLFFAVIATTRLGWPYQYTKESPRLRRIVALDSKRTIFPYGSNTSSTIENGLFIQAFDYRGITDLPEHTFLSGGTKPNCSAVADDYCQLPYYTAIFEMFRPEESRWVPMPNMPTIPYPLKLQQTDKKAALDRAGEQNNEVKMNFILRGGYDKVSLHITPLNGFALRNWSFTDIDVKKFGRRNTYFVFLSYGAEPPKQREFSIQLQYKGEDEHNMKELMGKPIIEIAVATHYAHGEYQFSNTLSELKQLISTRRETPHHAVGWWKWAMTGIFGVAEIIVHTF